MAEQPSGLFEGHQSRDCGAHRTVGPHRAWCFDCGEWCYPEDGCTGCRLGAFHRLPRWRSWLIERLGFHG